MNLNRFLSALALGGAVLFSSTLVVACAPEAPDGTETEEEGARSDADALSLPFQVLNVSKSAAPLGLTVLKTKAQYKAFFGSNPPASVNFNQSWVLHYSTGVQNTGGFKAEIIGVDRNGTGVNKKITVTTRDTSPGEGCFVTQALTNPQMTVKINKQTAGVPVEQVMEFVQTDCSVPNWCATALCGPKQMCIEETDTCKNTFCMLAKCANGYQCDDEAAACVPRECDPNVADTCPSGFACTNLIQCITAPCPADYRCHEAPCGTTTFEGECDNNVLKYCENNTLVSVDCQSSSCGFDASHSWYDCL